MGESLGGNWKLGGEGGGGECAEGTVPHSRGPPRALVPRRQTMVPRHRTRDRHNGDPKEMSIWRARTVKALRSVCPNEASTTYSAVLLYISLLYQQTLLPRGKLVPRVIDSSA